jgi:hypothetical protein
MSIQLISPVRITEANKTLVATGDNVLLEFELPFRRCHS